DMDGADRHCAPGSRGAGPPTPYGGTLRQGVEAPAPRGGVPWKGLAYSAALFLLALLSKETALALAPVLVCAAWLAGWRGPKLIAASLTALVPAILYLCMRSSLNPSGMASPLSQLDSASSGRAF